MSIWNRPGSCARRLASSGCSLLWLSRGRPGRPGAEDVHTIAIPPFTNATVRYKLTDSLPEAIGREFIARTHYQIVNDPTQADAVLRGSGGQLRRLSDPDRPSYRPHQRPANQS